MTSRQGLTIALLGLGIAVQCAIPLLPPLNGWFFNHPESTAFDEVFFAVLGAGALFGLMIMVGGLIASAVLALAKHEVHR